MYSGAFMVLRNHKEQTTAVIDGREVAPQDADKYMYDDNPEEQKVVSILWVTFR